MLSSSSSSYDVHTAAASLPDSSATCSIVSGSSNLIPADGRHGNTEHLTVFMRNSHHYSSKITRDIKPDNDKKMFSETIIEKPSISHNGVHELKVLPTIILVTASTQTEDYTPVDRNTDCKQTIHQKCTKDSVASPDIGKPAPPPVLSPIPVAPPICSPEAPPLPLAPPLPSAPPCPPSFNFSMNMTTIKPTKPNIKPNVLMRPLFWKRILIDYKELGTDTNIWKHELPSTSIDISEFERLFGQNKNSPVKRSLQDCLIKSHSRGSKNKCIKVLDSNRSRGVAIRLKTMHCGMSDIKNAIYKMESLCNNKDPIIDAESLRNLYSLRANKIELEKIKQAIIENPNGVLDEPEQFLFEISEMSHFSERVECLCFRKSLLESVFSIDQQLKSVEKACEAVRNNKTIREIFQLILNFGNYMNGNTNRGQADAFNITTLSKIKDVKSIDGSLSLLQYVIRTHKRTKCSENFDLDLPEIQLLHQASLVSFGDINNEYNTFKSQLKLHRSKAETVYTECDADLLQPFKDLIEDFFDSADDMLSIQKTSLDANKNNYKELITYLAQESANKKDEICVSELFAELKLFCDIFTVEWKHEEQRIAKEMFSKVERTRKERLSAAKRRRSHVVNQQPSSQITPCNQNASSQMRIRCNQIRRDQPTDRKQTLAQFRIARSLSREDNCQLKIEEENEPEVKAPILRSVLRKPRIIQRVSETKDLTSSNEDLYTAQTKLRSVHERLCQRRDSRHKDFIELPQKSPPNLLYETNLL